MIKVIDKNVIEIDGALYWAFPKRVAEIEQLQAEV